MKKSPEWPEALFFLDCYFSSQSCNIRQQFHGEEKKVDQGVSKGKEN